MQTIWMYLPSIYLKFLFIYQCNVINTKYPPVNHWF